MNDTIELRSELSKVIKKLVKETHLLPSQNSASRIFRPEQEVRCSIKGRWKINALAVLGLILLLRDEEEDTNNLVYWNLLSSYLEHSTSFNLVQNAKIQILALDENLIWENVLQENYFGRTEAEIFGYLLQPSVKEKLRESYRIYIRSPRKKVKRLNRCEYRDHGSLGGDKEFLRARNFKTDELLQKLIDQRISYQYTFSELKEMFS